MPDSYRVDYYNSNIRSASSCLDFELLPLQIISVFELKTESKDSDVGQLLDYSPESRLFILGVITDFRDIRFTKVSRSNDADNIEYATSVKALKDENEHLLD